MSLAKPCPRCSTVLRPHEDAKARCFLCEACGGRWVERRDLESWAAPEFVAQVFPRLLAPEATRGGRCPGCRGKMYRMALPLALSELVLDRCAECEAVWFERDGIRAVPLSERERLRRTRERVDVDTSPELPLPLTVATLVGLPIESPTDLRLGRPLLTWSLAGAILLVMLAAKAGDGFDEVLQHWGFVPNESLRHVGLTWVTSFFLHANWVHLLGNLYFLLMFGNDVEHELGRLRYAILLAGSTFLGVLAHTVGDVSSSVPLVGASGGISGVLAFYALAFSRRKIYVSLWFVTLTLPRPSFAPLGIPAIWLFLYWLVMQGVTALLQSQGLTSVSGLGHLGGAAGGIAAWWAWQRRVV